jgi:hypothetical protein
MPQNKTVNCTMKGNWIKKKFTTFDDEGTIHQNTASLLGMEISESTKYLWCSRAGQAYYYTESDTMKLSIVISTSSPLRPPVTSSIVLHSIVLTWESFHSLLLHVCKQWIQCMRPLVWLYIVTLLLMLRGRQWLWHTKYKFISMKPAPSKQTLSTVTE